MDILDFFNDGSLEAAEFQNVKVTNTQSEEELKKWSTEENLPEGRKALNLLNKGFALQKAAILNNLYRLVKEREFPDVLRFVFVRDRQKELPTWEENLQVEAGNGFLIALSRNAIPQQHLEMLLGVALTLLSTWSAPVHGVWLQVFSMLLKASNVVTIKKNCIPVALHLGEYSQAVSTRIVATHLIGLLAEHLQQEFRGDILQKSMLLSQDTSFDIRKSMCIQLKKICRAVSEELQPRVFGEVLKLVNDEEIEVKCEAVSLLIDIIDLLPYEFIQGQVVPVIREDLLGTRELALREKMADVFGMLIVKLEAELQDETFRAQCLAFFQSLVTSTSEKERKSAAFNMPAVLSTLGGSAFAEDLQPLYEALSRDPAADVRMTVALSFHEILRLAPGEAQALHSIFLAFLNEPPLACVLIKHLSAILPLISAEVSCAELMTQLVNLIASSLPWRLLETLLTELQAVLSVFPLSEIVEKLQPVLLTLIPKSCLPAKVKIAKLLTEIIHSNYISEKRSELCSVLVSLLGNSENAQDRIVFVDFCVKILSLNSRRFFRKHFFAVLMQLIEDPIKNVRLKVALHLAMFNAAFCTQEDMQSEMSSAVSRLQSDSDPEVNRLAEEAQMQVMSRDYWNSVQTSEKDEQVKQRREDEQDLQEQRVSCYIGAGRSKEEVSPRPYRKGEDGLLDAI